MAVQKFNNPIDNTIQHFYDRAGIEAANAVSVFSQFSDRKSMPTKMGKTYKISKFEHIYDLSSKDSDFAVKGYLGKRDLAAFMATLVEGGGVHLAEGQTGGNEVSVNKVTVEATIARYGKQITYTDEATFFSEDDVQTKYREELGYDMGQLFEDLVQKDMVTGAGVVVYPSNALLIDQLGIGIEEDDTGADEYKVSYDLIRKTVKALRRNRAKMNTEIVTGSVKIGTRPINKAFYGICGPEVKFDLEGLTRGSGHAEEFAFVPAYEYAAASNLAEGEIGSMHDVRFIEAEGAMMEAGAGAEIPADYAGSLSHDGTNFNVFSIVFPTKGSFATLGLKGQGKLTFHAKAPTDVDSGNRFGTTGFFSANMFYAGLVLEPEKLAVVKVLASA